MTHPYLQKCLELSERASPKPWRQEFNLHRGYCVWGNCGDTGSMLLAACSYAAFDRHNAELIAFSRTALPKVCEALKLALAALSDIAKMRYDALNQADLVADEANLAVSKLFDDADGGA